MHVRFAGLWLAALAVTAAQESPPSVAAEDGRGSLREPNLDHPHEAMGKKGANQLFYFPTRDEPSTPATWGLKYEPIDFHSSDGTPLHGWFIPAKNKAPKGTVIFSHGNAGSISYHLGFCTWLAEASYNVIIYDYRGFGKSGGTVDRRGMIDDVKAAFRYALKRPDIDITRLVSYGHSLGGAQSVTALGETPVKGLRAIIIDASFASYHAMAGIFGGQLAASLVSDELAPKDFVKKLAPVPLLVVHGDADEIVPVSQGLQLFKAAAEPKTLFEVKSGRHGTALTEDHGAYRRKLLAWLDEVMKG